VKVFIVKYGEDLPLPGHSIRHQRTTLINNVLNQRGHETVWWSSSFRHHTKSFYVHADTSFKINPLSELRLLHAPGYDKHLSLTRLWNHGLIAKKLKRDFEALRHNPPDLLFVSYPAIETSYVSAQYAKIWNIPLVLDARDMWPDTFLEPVPLSLRLPFRIALEPYFAMGRYAFKGASAVFGITEEFVDWGIKKANRVRGPFDRSYPLAYEDRKISEFERQAAQIFCDTILKTKVPVRLRALFAGSFSRHFDFDPILKAAAANPACQFILCGNGDTLNKTLRDASGLHNVIFPGWIDFPKLRMLQESSHVGLAPYKNTPSFSKSLPNKIVEYMAKGLVVASSLKGYAEDIIAKERLGFTYDIEKAESLSDRLKNLQPESSEFQLQRHKNLEYFEKHFKAETVYQDLVITLETIVSGQRTFEIVA